MSLPGVGALPGVEESLLLRSLDVLTNDAKYTMRADEAECCDACRKRSIAYMAGGNILAATLAAVGSRFGLRLRLLDLRALVMVCGSGITGGLAGWTMASAACFRSVLALPASPLADGLDQVARAHGTPSLRARWALLADEAPAPRESPEFSPSASFSGARPGAVFKTGPQGIGYYRDTGVPPGSPADASKASPPAEP